MKWAFNTVKAAQDHRKMDHVRQSHQSSQLPKKCIIYSLKKGGKINVT